MRWSIASLLVPCSLTLTLVACHGQESESPLGTGSSEGGQSWSADGRSAESAAGYGRAGDGDGDAAAEAAPVGANAGADRSWDGAASDRVAIEDSRPSLGTAYGESRRSSIESVGFQRADFSAPDVVFTIRYDDASGVRSAARRVRSRAWSDEAMQGHGGLSFALLDSAERVLPAATVGSELFAVGRPQSRYSLAIANDTGTAYELVASVDGLDIVDGRAASFEKRGYVIDPFSSMVIEGWRTSEDTVAAFRFSSIEDSYAERLGDGRNIGVIGAALFREAPPSWDEWRSPDEGWRRDGADPFPGN